MTQEVDRVAKKLQKRVRDYEVRDVLEFVAAIGLEQYLANFEKHKIDGKKLVDLDALNLETRLGMQSRIHKKKLTNALDHLEKISQAFRPLKEKHPIFDDDEENENPFKRGSLLANMRESVDSFKIEASYDTHTKLFEEREVVKRLDFSKQRPEPEERPALQEKKQRGDVVLPPSLPEDETAELRIERRQRELRQLIDMEKREMKREAVVSSRVLEASQFNLKKHREPQVLRADLAPPSHVLNLVRLDQRGPADGSPAEQTVTQEGITIGRSSANGLVLTDDTISQKHCQVYWKNGSFYVQDLGSTFGTFFRVGMNRLQEGEVYELGSVELVVRRVHVPARPGPLSLIKSIPVDLLFAEPQEPGPLAFVSLQLTKDGVVRRECEVLEEATVGRKLTCAIAVPEDDHLSGTHCRILLKDGAFWIEDLNSMNGLYLRLSPEKQVSAPLRLNGNGELRLGSYTKFRTSQAVRV